MYKSMNYFKKYITAFLFLSFLAGCSEPSIESDDEFVFNKVFMINTGEKKRIVIKTEKNVFISSNFVDMTYEETEKCGMCLHLTRLPNVVDAHKINSITSSSNYGVGADAIPVNGVIEIIMNHDYKSAKRIQVQARGDRSTE